MTRPVAFLKWCGGLAFLAVVYALSATPASADSLYLGYSSGHYYRPAHYHHPHPYWGPHYPAPYYGSRVVFVNPHPVYAPPPVVYAQPPVVYSPAPIDATPASAPYRTADGRYCREYQAQVVVNGMPQSSYGTACLQPDGSWRVEN